jgi:hypothetical protein
MAFKVRLGEGTQDCGDDDVYDFVADGVLVLHFAEPGRWSEYYPPERMEAHRRRAQPPAR